MITDDHGGRMFVCSDSSYCEDRRAKGHIGKELAVAEALDYVDRGEGASHDA